MSCGLGNLYPTEILVQVLYNKAWLFWILKCVNRTYTPSLEDVGSYLALHWVPTRADGKQGAPLVAFSSQPVMAGCLDLYGALSY